MHCYTYTHAIVFVVIAFIVIESGCSNGGSSCSIRCKQNCYYNSINQCGCHGRKDKTFVMEDVEFPWVVPPGEGNTRAIPTSLGIVVAVSAAMKSRMPTLRKHISEFVEFSSTRDAGNSVADYVISLVTESKHNEVTKRSVKSRIFKWLDDLAVAVGTDCSMPLLDYTIRVAKKVRHGSKIFIYTDAVTIDIHLAQNLTQIMEQKSLTLHLIFLKKQLCNPYTGKGEYYYNWQQKLNNWTLEMNNDNNNNNNNNNSNSNTGVAKDCLQHPQQVSAYLLLTIPPPETHILSVLPILILIGILLILAVNGICYIRNSQFFKDFMKNYETHFTICKKVFCKN